MWASAPTEGFAELIIMGDSHLFWGWLMPV
jgi:hypothetical protein